MIRYLGWCPAGPEARPVLARLAIKQMLDIDIWNHIAHLTCNSEPSTPLTIMESSNMLRQLLRTPDSSRIAFSTYARPHTRTFALLAPTLPHPRFLSVPRIIQPSFWASMIPMSLRRRSEHHKPKEWNPATPYIILGLLVGSQAIHILWLKQERAHNLRKTEAKIGILREVIERVQSGEDVPVEKLLGTGDENLEREWSEGKSCNKLQPSYGKHLEY